MKFLPTNLLFGNGLSLFRILGSTSRAIGIAKQLSPLITEIKPIISKVPLLMERLQKLRGIGNNLTYLNTPKSSYDMKEYPQTQSGPVFFQ